MNFQGLYIAATKRNSGKTTISIAIMRLLKDKGITVQPFKKGPDFIDPMWLSLASKRNCYNLDFYFLSKDKVLKHFLEYSVNSDISIIEGNHGLHDSLDIQGKSSNASMSKLLGLPVVLVIDVSELNRGVVPLIMGFKKFDEDVNIKGVILNKVHNKRHEKNLIKYIKHYTDLKIVGVVPNDQELSIKQRHLGLMSTLSKDEIEKFIEHISAKLSGNIDIDAIIKISKIAKKINYPDDDLPKKKKILKKGVKDSLKIGLAYDNAFNFYYNENIEELKRLGCEIIPFSPLNDSNLPDVDALYIGGGFPELFCKDLDVNISLKSDIREKIEIGLPVYAECGGLMYLCRSIIYDNVDNVRREMVGIINAEVKLTKKPNGHGYTKLKPVCYDKNSSLWFNKIRIIKGHEFHHSYLEISEDYKPVFAFNVKKGFGVNGLYDGIIYKNVLASYTHIYSPSEPQWFKSWTIFIKKIKKITPDCNKIIL